MNFTYVDVLIPLSLSQSYTYKVSTEWHSEIEIGKRVVVQFGRNKLYTALIYKIHNITPQEYKAKDIIEVLDKKPIVNQLQFYIWKWISKYYICKIGDIMASAVPSGLKLNSESIIILNQDYIDKNLDLNEKDAFVYEEIKKRKKISIQEIQKLLKSNKITNSIQYFLNKKYIHIEEFIVEKYKSKVVVFIELNKKYNTQESINQLIEQLKNAKNQKKILLMYLEISKSLNSPKNVTKTELLSKSNANNSSLKGLIEKKILKEKRNETSRFAFDNKPIKTNLVLTNDQQIALNQIKEGFSLNKNVLLKGITSSGKTEIYISLIKEYIKNNKQILYLLPEIALTIQLIERLKQYFGNIVGVYHSKYSSNERVEVWQNLIENKNYKIIIGVRSAIFLPFTNLGLIIVDEEHETIFKQHSPSPRYQARDVATILAKKCNAQVLLGSATPSIESYYNTKNKKYFLVELNKRYKNVPLPKVIIADIKKSMKQKSMKIDFTYELYTAIKEELEKKNQIILFQNKRGFSVYIQCSNCGWIPQCKNCDISLNYHKFFEHLICHYCNYQTKLIHKCESCGHNSIKLMGVGTEKIEEDTQILFPDATIARLDLDTTRKKNAYKRIISQFEQNRIDILIGTQMITKGLDFDNVSLVGILNADHLMNFQDFRAHERSYQLMSQVAGRAGRRENIGKVIIQTYQPDHHILKQVIHQDFNKMYEMQLNERNKFHYPPFFRLILIKVKHIHKDEVENGAKKLADLLKKHMKKLDILGPVFPVISKIKNKYIMNILVKIPNTNNLHSHKSNIKYIIDSFSNTNEYKKLTVLIDVDPY